VVGLVTKAVMFQRVLCIVPHHVVVGIVRSKSGLSCRVAGWGRCNLW
jgi:hypothetical protein